MDLCIQIEKKKIQEIPVLVCRNTNKSNKGYIILLHRLLEDKEHEIILGYYLSQLGYEVILPDLLYHGESPFSVRESKRMDFNKLYTEMDKNMELIRILLNYVENQKIGIIGTSYGGMLALAAGTKFDEIKYIGALCTCVNWEKLIVNSSFENFRLFSTERPVINFQDVQKEIKKFDPIYNVDKFKGKNVILMNGELDTTFNYSLIEPFYKKMVEEQNIVTWKKYKKTGHNVSYEMIRDLQEWLK